MYRTPRQEAGAVGPGALISRGRLPYDQVATDRPISSHLYREGDIGISGRRDAATASRRRMRHPRILNAKAGPYQLKAIVGPYPPPLSLKLRDAVGVQIRAQLLTSAIHSKPGIPETQYGEIYALRPSVLIQKAHTR